MRLHPEDGLFVMCCQWALTIGALLSIAYVLRWIFSEDGKHPIKEKIVRFFYEKHTVPTSVKVVIGVIIVALFVLAAIKG